MIYSLLSKFSSKTSIPEITDQESENRKINFLRILLGLTIIYRVGWIIFTGPYYSDKFDLFPALLVFSSAVLFTLGLFTPLALILNLFLSNWFDKMYYMGTLGTSLLTILQIVLLLVQTGSHYSLDRYILNKFPGSLVSTWLTKLYKSTGFSDPIRFRVVYFLAFLVYGIMSFGALLIHLDDPYWMNGQTFHALSVNAYLSPNFSFFRILESSFPGFMEFISKASAIGQSIFQFLMLGLIFFKPGKWFIMLWGFGFFLFSEFFLQLSYLPKIEMLLWAAIFFRGSQSQKIQVLYDDYCNLCKNAVTFLNVADIFRNLEFLPLSENEVIRKNFNLDAERIREDIHGISTGKVVAGFDLYYLIFRRLPLLWLFFPVMLLGKWTGIGRIVYGWIARNRLRFFGTCEVSFKLNQPEQVLFPNGFAPTGLGQKLISMYGFSVLLFISTLAHIERIPAKLMGLDLYGKYKKALYFAGYQVPDVFNSRDLKMGDTWYELKRKDEGTSLWTWVPIHSHEGGRQWYHRSDIIYFSNSLPYHRRAISTKLWVPETGFIHDIQLILAIARFDYRFQKLSGEVLYDLHIFKNRSSDVSLSPAIKYRPVFGMHTTFVIKDGLVDTNGLRSRIKLLQE